MPSLPEHLAPIFVATHHKVGTVWMMTTFMRIAQANGWEYVHLNEGESGWALRDDKQAFFESRLEAGLGGEAGRRAIFHDYHAAIPDLRSCIERCGGRGVHVVRDPRDMLLSAVRFHMKANEPWLDEVDARWGMTFREKLGSYGLLEDRVRFEMDTYMGWTIERMGAFDLQGVFIDVRYEDLIVDADMRAFHEVLVHLGVRGRDLINGLGAYWSSSLFGERSEHDRAATAGHVFDSSVMQWRRLLPERCVEEIESRFGTVIDRFEYPRLGAV